MATDSDNYLSNNRQQTHRGRGNEQWLLGKYLPAI